MANLPARNILDGSALPVTSQMKTAMGSLRDYLADLLGTDSGDKAGAADALGAYRKGTVLGAVSQAAGVPTGALMEYISNANGKAWRYAGGMQICTHTLPSFTAAGMATTNVPWTYPAVFGAMPIVPAWIGVPNTNGDVAGFIYTQGISTTAGAQAFKNNTSAQLVSDTLAMAIGRWF